MSKFLSLLKLRNFINAGDSALEVGISTEASTNPRFRIDAGGTHNWGEGGATATDTNLYRPTGLPNTLKTDDTFIATGGLTVKTTEIDTASAITGQALVFNGTKFAPAAVGGGGGSGGITVSDTAPTAPTEGDLWFESDTGLTYVYYDSFWIEIGAGSSYDPVTNTIQFKGDLLVGTGPASISRQTVGTDSQRLIANSSTTTGVSWANDSTNTVIDAKGDLLVGATNDVLAKLPVGTNGQVLTANSSATNGVLWSNNADFAAQFTYKVGDTGPGGGIIFFVDRFNEYSTFTYLEVAPSSTEVLRPWAGSAYWGVAVTNASSKRLGDGYQNTLNIIAQGNTDPATCAAKYCDALTYGGQSDWYLPSAGELEIIFRTVYLQLGLGSFTSGGAAYGDYWTSSQSVDYAGNDAVRVSFYQGTVGEANKGSGAFVRPMRRF